MKCEECGKVIAGPARYVLVPVVYGDSVVKEERCLCQDCRFPRVRRVNSVKWGMCGKRRIFGDD